MNKDNEKKDEILKTLKSHLQSHNIEFIDQEDSIDFQCQQCGRCCRNRNDLILNPFDVYKGAKYLNITPMEFLEKYTLPSLGGTSKIPIVLLKTEENGNCPFLKLGGDFKYKCEIHEAKPGVCANHPIGVVRNFQRTDHTSSISFIKTEQCPNSKGHNELHKVKDWCKDYLDNIEEIKIAQDLQTLVDQYFPCNVFHALTSDLLTEKKEESFTEDQKEVKEQLINLFDNFAVRYVFYIYAHYNTSRPFIEQAKENKETITNNIIIPIQRLLKDFCASVSPELIKILEDVAHMSYDKFFMTNPEE